MNKQPMYIKGDFALIAKYNKFDNCVEIGDLNNPSDGWVDYDPTQGASSDELTEICNSLYDRCLLAELGIKGFTPANEQILKRVYTLFFYFNLLHFPKSLLDLG